MKSAYFLDINILIESSPKAWIVDKNNPNHPITKIDISDFNLFKSGIFKNQNNKIDFNGKLFWLSTDFINTLKIKCKKNKSDISNLGISMQEFLNPELTKNIDFVINKEILNSLSKSNDIYIICSKNKKEFFNNQISSLELFMKKMGLYIKGYYFTSETFLNLDSDKIAYIKSKIIIQHLIGLKSENDTLTDVKISHYNEIIYWDDDKKSIKMSMSINSILEKLLDKSSDYTKSYVKDIIKNNNPSLIYREHTHNKSNRFIEGSVQISFSNLIRKFENYNH